MDQIVRISEWASSFLLLELGTFLTKFKKSRRSLETKQQVEENGARMKA